MMTVRLSLPALVLIVALVGAGAFAAGRAMPAGSSETSSAPVSAGPEPAMAEPVDTEEPLPPGHPPTSGPVVAAGALPAGHPNVDRGAGGPGAAAMAGAKAGGFEMPPAGDASVEWKAPPRWQLLPSTSKMRLATYHVPHAPGDTEDPELSVVQAGGTVDANAQRWVGQFDEAGQKTAKRTVRNVGPLEVTIVEVQGKYSGMGTEGSAGWALLGGIVSSPTMTTPCFFKLTGPAKSVAAARTDFDALIGSLTPRDTH
jgi:hypothetical protein